MYYYQKILFQHHQAVSMCISVCLPQMTLWKWNNRETKMGRGSQKNSDLEEMIEPLFDDKIGCQVHNPQCSYEHHLSHSDIGNVFISYLKLLLKVRRNFSFFFCKTQFSKSLVHTSCCQTYGKRKAFILQSGIRLKCQDLSLLFYLKISEPFNQKIVVMQRKLCYQCFNIMCHDFQV